MLRAAVLHSSPRPPWSTNRLLHALARAGFETTYILWDMLGVKTGSDCRLLYRGRCAAFDALLVRGMGRGLTPEKLVYRYGVLEAAEKDGTLVVNPPAAVRTARDKMASMMKLMECGVSVPDTYVYESPAAALRTVRQLGKAVIKPLMGSLGLGSFLVDSEDTAYYIANLLAELNQPIYVQRYIEKRGARDIRVFIVDGEPIAAIYRRSSTWKTNIAQGATPTPAPLQGPHIDLAIRAAECLGLIYAGVDIAEDPQGNHYVLEVNASPLWRGLYRATGIDPAPAIAEAVKRHLKK